MALKTGDAVLMPSAAAMQWRQGVTFISPDRILLPELRGSDVAGRRW